MFSLMIPLVALSACKKSADNPVGPPEYENVISNPSFENNGIASLAGWQVETNFDSTVRFSEDVPQSGGRWSVVLVVADRVIARLRTTVTAPAGTHRYRLSVWAKSQGSIGTARLVFNKAIRKSITISDTTWTLYQVADTLSTVHGDSLFVELDGGVAYGRNETFFDLCRLEKAK